LAYYAKAKGRSAWWCVMGFLSCIGLVILGLLKDLEKEETKRISNIANTDTDELAKIASLKDKGMITEEEYCILKTRYFNSIK
jgi:hypothetical protein